MTTMLLSALIVPLILTSLATSRHGHWLTIIAPLPALAVAITSISWSPQILSLEWVLLGVQVGLDDTGRMFLIASAVVWLAAAGYAAATLRHSPGAGRFRIFYLLAMSGNFTLVLAQDMATFLVGFAVMGLSAYGLVAHRSSVSACRAGRLYLTWTIVGEVALFGAMALLAAESKGLDFEGLRTSTPSHFAVAMVVMAFGIKIALPGLHVWLPVTYAAAPAAGAAVLSGPMISAGLLGWMRFLPPGDDALVPWGWFLIAAGLFGTLYGVTIGLMQRRPKLVLGYSSISKMGVLTSGFGAALALPGAAPLLLSALTLYAIHHLWVKSALFLGVDLIRRGAARPWVLAGLIALALVLVGAPLTSGALVKAALAGAIADNASWLVAWLSVAAVASTLLMGRFAYLLFTARVCRPVAGGPALSLWTTFVALIVAAPFLLGHPQELASGGLPVALGVAIVLAVWRYRPRSLAALIGRVPPADILHPVRRVVRRALIFRVIPRARRVAYAAETEFHRFQRSIASAGDRWLQPNSTAPTGTGAARFE